MGDVSSGVDAEDASRLGELKSAKRGYAQIEADRESVCKQDLNGGRERQAVRRRPRTFKVRRIVSLRRFSYAKLGRAQEH